MKKSFIAAVTVGLCLGMSSFGIGAPSVYPTGTTIYDPSQAQNGYVLISVDYPDVYAKVDSRDVPFAGKVDYNGPGGLTSSVTSDKVFLIDMNGNVVHTWKDLGGNKKCYLLPNGNLLSISTFQSAVIEYNWEGKEVWRFASKLAPHHDGRRLDNGNTLILCYENVPAANYEKVVNQTTQWWGTQDRKNAKLRGDTIIEVSPEGKIVWSWSSSEHLDINRYMPLTNMNDWTHGNTVSIIPPNKWFDAGDKRFKPGNILYNPRHFDEFVIIDKESGDIVWSLKNFKALGGLGQCHEPIMIPKGKPGEGNIMVFDNGLFTRTRDHAGQSAVWEINPTNCKAEWRYFPAQSGSFRFLSKFKGAAYKLDNGNVLISEDFGGRVFQVKPDPTHNDGGAIVWEYVYPSVISRTTMYPYDFCPQLKAMSKPAELKVSPLDPISWQILPDVERKGSNVVKLK